MNKQKSSKGVLQKEPTKIKRVAKEYFIKIFNRGFLKLIFSCKGLFFKRLSMEEAEFLERRAVIEELELALEESDSDKTPGPDGLNFGVIKSIWNEIKVDMLNFVNSFILEGYLSSGINSSFIALIPNRKDARQWSYYRPISLSNCSLKLLTEVMESRLSRVMEKLISNTHTGFIQGRQISEGILICNKVLHSLKIGQSSGIIIKLDFEKLFDSVDCHCILDVMEALGFGETWCDMIHSLLKFMKV